MHRHDMPQIVGRYLRLEKMGDIYKTLCPFHKDDKTQSLTVYSDHAYCFGCGKWLGPVKFLTYYLHISINEAKERLGEPVTILPNFAKQIKNPEAISPEIIKNWHAMLKSHRKYFNDRLFTDQTIDREMWGWDGHRYVITVWKDEPGVDCMSVRRRASKKDVMPKFIGLKGYNGKCLYNRWHLEQFYSEWPKSVPKVAYIFFGEWDSALALQDGLPAISPTNGQNSWLPEWDSFLSEYSVIVVPDKKEEMRGFQLASRFPGRSSVVLWPDGDYDDYNSFRLLGGTVEDFMGILGEAVTPQFEIECFWEQDL